MTDKLTNKPESSQKVRDVLRTLEESQLVQIEKMIALRELSAEVVHLDETTFKWNHACLSGYAEGYRKEQT